MKPIGDCIFVVYFLMIFASLVRFYVFFMPPGGSKMLAVDVSIGPYQWLGRSPSYHEVLTPVQLLLRLQNHHHHTQAATTTTLQTSLAMDQEEKKQVQSIRDQLKGHSLPDGGEILGSINLSSSEFTATSNRAHIVRQYESGSTASERKTTRETPDRKGLTFSLFSLEDLRQYFVRKLINAVSVCILLAIYLFCSKVSLRLRVRSSTQPSASQVEIVERILLSLSDFAATIDNSPYEPIIYPRFFRCDARKQPIPAPPPKALDKPKVSQLVERKLLSLSDFAAFIDNIHIANKENCTVPLETTRKPPVPAPAPAPAPAPPPKALEKPKVPKKRKLAKGKESVTLENLQQYSGHKRKDVAASLGVSVSTFKRMCRLQGITRWQNQMGSSGSVSKPPDQHGERNTSTACETPSHNVQTGMEGELFGQNEVANVFRRDFVGGPIALNTDGLTFLECSDAVAPSQPKATILDTIPHLTEGSSECAFQVKNQSTQFTANPYPNGLVDPHPQIALTQIRSENMERLEDCRNLLAPWKEPLPEGHVFGSVDWTVRSCSDLALSQPMPTMPHTTGGSEYWRNSLALLEKHLLEENDYGSNNFTALSCFDPGPSQPMHTIPHTMPTIPQMMPLLTERQDMRSVRLKATYGNTTIKFPLPSGFSELEEEVSKRLEFERGSFKLEYKDEEGDSVLIACDEDVRDYLRLLTSMGNQVVKLFVLDKVPNTTNFCDNCRSLKCKRP